MSKNSFFFQNFRELSNARKQFNNLERAAANIQKPNNNQRVVSENDQDTTDVESTSSALQWQDDPEFQKKVK